MSWTIEQLNAGIKQAHAEGKMDIARDLATQAMALQQQQQQPQQEAPQERLGYFDAESYTPENLYASAEQRVKGFVAGVGDFVEQGGNSLEENVIGLRDGALRADQYIQNAAGNTSVNHQDALDGLNEELAVNRRRQALVPDGIGKTLGGIGGEVVTAAPLLGLGVPGGIIRGAAAGAAEGFALESLTNAGGLVDRANAGVTGAVGGLIGGALVPAVGKGVGYLGRKGQAKDIYANENLGHTAEGDLAMREAEEIGVPLDRVDAQKQGYAARGDVQNAQLPEYVKYRDEIGETTAQAGRDKISELGDIRGDGGTPALRSNSANEIQKGLDANRVADDEAVKAAYKSVADDVGTETKLSVPNMRANLQTHIEELLDVGEEAAAKGLQRQLDRHAPEGADISVQGMMDLRKGVTKLWKPNAGTSNRIVEEFKMSLDDTMSTSSLGGAGQQSVDGFKTATQTARANFEKYRRGTTAEKATRLNADGNAAQVPTEMMDKLFTKGNVDDLVSFKKQFEGQPELLAKVEQSANGKLMGMIDSAMDNKAGDFNSKNFRTAMKNWTPEFREELFGKEGAEALGKFERSTKLQGSTTSRQGNHTNSGTAPALERMFDFLGQLPLVRSSPFATGLLSVGKATSGKLSRAAKRSGLEDDARRLMEGNLPKEEVAKVQKKLIEKLQAENPAWGQGDLAAQVVRRWMASVTGDAGNSERKYELNQAKRAQQ